MENIAKALSKQVDPLLLKKQVEIYKKIKESFWLGKDEECVEKIGKFVEITIRVLEYITTGNFTSLDEELRISETLKKFENLPKQDFPESIRIMIPRILYSLYTFRSKRGGAHVKDINPNHIDASYVVSTCDWIMAELVRLYHTKNEKEIQSIIDSMVDKKVPILEEFGNDIKILNPSISIPDQILIILYKKHPNPVSTNELKRWIKTTTYINTVLKRLDDKGFVYRKNKENIITRKGIAYVENKFKEELQ